MQENEFEKRVQQEMGEFRLRPSEAVWGKVEKQLRKKKRRRVIFFIFMLAGLSLLGYSGYFFTKTNSKQNLVQQDNNSLPGIEKTGTGSNKQPASPTIEGTTANDQAVTNENQLSPIKEKKQNEKKSNVLNNEKSTIAEHDIAVKHKKRTRKISPENPVIAKSAGNRNVDKTRDNTQPAENQTRQNDRSSTDPVDKANIARQDIAKNNLPQGDSKTTEQKGADKIADQKINEPAKTDSIMASALKTDEAIAVTKKKQPGSKIKLGMDLSVGISSSSSHNAFSIFDVAKSAVLDYNSPGNSTGGGGLGGYVRISPSDIKAGPAFRAGVLAELQLSKRSSVSSGLQYVYLSNNISVGYYSDTTVVVNNSFSQSSRVDAIYRGKHQKEYTNRFHFIQIPIQYQWQINKGTRLPLLWSIGASAGYLLATNGLVYDTAANGIYYHDDDAFNKFQFNLTTGLSFRFGNKGKIQWSLGPELSFGMNKLMKDDYTKKQYLLYSGLTGRLFFQKRNK